MWTSEDHKAIAEAAERIHGVLERHRSDLTMQAMGLLNESLNDLRLAEKYQEAAS